MEKKFATSTLILILLAVVIALVSIVVSDELVLALRNVAYIAMFFLLLASAILVQFWRFYFIKRRGYSAELDQEKELEFFHDYPPGSLKRLADEENRYFLCHEKGKLFLRYAPHKHIDDRRADGDELMWLSVDRDRDWCRVVLSSRSAAGRSLEDLQGEITS